MEYKILVTGGGTGGHVYPGITICQALIDRNPRTEILYVGTPRGLESDLVPKTGIPLKLINVTGLPRRLSLQAAKSLLLAGHGFWEAVRIIKEFKPQVVVGTGGYVCGPVLLAAYLSGRPTLIQEQNALPGFTNKILGRIVNRVCLGFPEAGRFFPYEKVIVTGNPIRPEIGNIKRKEACKKLGLNSEHFTFLAFGASQGAKSINRVLVDVLPEMLTRWPNFQSLLITGKASYELITAELKKKLSANCAERLKIFPYLHEMGAAWAAADLALCRAGALTIAELTCQGVPAVLVPYPYAAGDHQNYNAKVLEEAGAARIIQDRDLTREKVLNLLTELYTNPALCRKMAAAGKKLGKPEATARIVTEILSLI